MIVVVVDNGGFGSIDAFAWITFGMSYGNCFSVLVDFVVLVCLFGVVGVCVDSVVDLECVLSVVCECDGIMLIYCLVEDGEIFGLGVFWDFGVL